MAETESILDLTKGLYRRIYAGFINGKRINAVSMECEAFFWRLHGVIDDFGNLHADPALVRSDTQGRRDFSLKQTETWLSELASRQLLVFYEDLSSNDTFLHIHGFLLLQPAGRNGRRIRRYPAYHGESGESEGLDSPHCDIRGSPGERDNGNGSGNGSGKGVQGENDYPLGMIRVWDAAPAAARDRSSRPDMLTVWRKLKLEAYVDEVIEGLERWKRSEAWTKKDGDFIPGLHRWLKSKKWKDQPAGSKLPAPARPETDEQARDRVKMLEERQRADHDRTRRVKAIADLSIEHRESVRAHVIAAAPAPAKRMLEKADYRMTDEPGRRLLALMFGQIAAEEVA